MQDTYLVSEAILRQTEPQLKSLVAEVQQDYSVDTEDAVYGTAFRYFLLFDRGKSLLESVLPDLTPLARFYNRYYWFVRFMTLHASVHGEDVGMEQQSFKLIESAEASGLEIDWVVFEEIDTLARQET